MCLNGFSEINILIRKHFDYAQCDIMITEAQRDKQILY